MKHFFFIHKIIFLVKKIIKFRFFSNYFQSLTVLWIPKIASGKSIFPIDRNSFLNRKYIFYSDKMRNSELYVWLCSLVLQRGFWIQCAIVVCIYGTDKKRMLVTRLKRIRWSNHICTLWCKTINSKTAESTAGIVLHQGGCKRGAKGAAPQILLHSFARDHCCRYM